MKKAQIKSPTSAISGVVALFALFLLIYILLLPPGEREEMLNLTSGDSESEIGEEGYTGGIVEILVSESPGLVEPSEEETRERDITSISLFTNVETETETLSNTFSISRSSFSNKYQELSFSLKDVANINEVGLLFYIKESKGDLIIRLNDKEIYSGKVSSADLPIELPVSYLRESNTLYLACSSPGWKVLTNNKYNLRDVKLVKRYNVENKKEIRAVTITSSEKSSLDTSTLRYFINCMADEKGLMNIIFNRRPIHTGFIVCDGKERELEIPAEYFVSGRNVFEFNIDKGDYTIEQIKLVNELEEAYPKFEFFVESDEYSDIKKKDKELKLHFDFADDTTKKKAYIWVSGESFKMDTLTDDKTYDISKYINSGENYVKIVPQTGFEIISLKIGLTE